MRRLTGRKLVTCGIATVCSLAGGSVIAADVVGVEIPKDYLEPFFNQHCIQCHGPDKEKGQVRLDTMDYTVTKNDQAQLWQDILDALNAAEMPPEDEKQPTDAEMTEVLNILTKSILKARNSLTDHGGKITLRKMNRREYINTVRDLFGFDLLESMVPSDSDYSKFDTVGSDQEFQAHQLDDYLKLGASLVSEGIKWSDEPRADPKTTRHDLNGDDEGGYKTPTQRSVGLPEPYVFNGKFLAGLGPAVAQGHDIKVTQKKVDPRANYKIRISAGLYEDPPEVRKFIHIGDFRSSTGGTYTTLKVSGTVDDPEVIEFDQPANFKIPQIVFSISENRSYIRGGTKGYLRAMGFSKESVASIWVDWVEVEGPIYDSEPSFFEKLYSSKKWNDRNVNELISKFVHEAFRRGPVEENYVTGLLEIFEARRKERVSFEKALSEVLGIALASPKFLYFGEEVDTPGQLSEREFAVRLAYFLWGGPPDERLYAAAASGQLADTAKLKAEVNRMLIDSRALGFYEGFVGQWAQLDRYDEMMNSLPKNKYVHFNKGIQYSAKQEVIRFFKLLVDENLSVSNFIDSDFIVANECLATHYGFLGLGTNEFVKLLLPDESPRGGLMTQAVFLSVGSNGERNSPVVRGKMVMEKLLDDPVPEPPPNVPELDSSTKEPITMREMVLKHQEQPQCASCHKKMDPIGFALENFDLTGSWRKFEDVGDISKEIRSDGVFPNGEEFEDIDGLRKIMLKHKDALARSMIKSLLSYGLGRTIEFSDTNKVEAMRESLRGTDYAMLDMIHTIVSDPIFRKK